MDDGVAVEGVAGATESLNDRFGDRAFATGREAASAVPSHPSFAKVFLGHLDDWKWPSCVDQRTDLSVRSGSYCGRSATKGGCRLHSRRPTPVLQRSSMDYDWESLKQDFLPKILQATGKHPF